MVTAPYHQLHAPFLPATQVPTLLYLQVVVPRAGRLQAVQPVRWLLGAWGGIDGAGSNQGRPLSHSLVLLAVPRSKQTRAKYVAVEFTGLGSTWRGLAYA